MKQLTKEDFLKLIGTDERNGTAMNIWDCLEQHRLAIVSTQMQKKFILDFHNEPAHPHGAWGQQTGTGMTKLEFFTAHALQGCLANSQYRMIDQKEVEAYAIKKAENTLTLLYQKERAGTQQI